MARKLMEYILNEEWTPDVGGRVEPVPKPRIIQASEVKRVDMSEGNVIFVKDGGNTTKQASGLGWAAEEREDRVSIDCRTTDAHGGAEALRGVRDPETWELEAYGGILGEVERILDRYRKGAAEYCIVEGFEIDDTSESRGFGRYRADVNVRLYRGPQNLTPPPSGEG